MLYCLIIDIDKQVNTDLHRDFTLDPGTHEGGLLGFDIRVEGAFKGSATTTDVRSGVWPS